MTPVPQNVLPVIDRASSPAHTGNLGNAVDFIAPKTTVLGVEYGTATWLGVTLTLDQSSHTEAMPILSIMDQTGNTQRRPLAT